MICVPDWPIDEPNEVPGPLTGAAVCPGVVRNPIGSPSEPFYQAPRRRTRPCPAIRARTISIDQASVDDKRRYTACPARLTSVLRFLPALHVPVATGC